MCFDEQSLIRELRRLPEIRQSAFAAAVTEHLFPYYVVYCERMGHPPEYVRNCIDIFWQRAMGKVIEEKEVHRNLELLGDLVPADDDGDWIPQRAGADDATAAAQYASQFLLSKNPQDVAWAARRAYEAADFLEDARRTSVLNSVVALSDSSSFGKLPELELSEQDELLKAVLWHEGQDESSLVQDLEQRSKAFASSLEESIRDTFSRS